MKIKSSTSIWSGKLFTPWLVGILLLLLGIPGGNPARAIIYNFDSGYTANTLLEGLPTSGTKWTRSTYSGNANAAFKVIPGHGVDWQQAVTTQASSGSITSSNYYINPTSTDLGGTFNASSSILDYSFSMRLESAPNTNVDDVQRVEIGNSIAVRFGLLGNGLVHAYTGTTPVALKTWKGGTTNFVALPGVYFTVSGQVNFATKTCTVFLNGVAQTINGPSDTTNFAFNVPAANSPQVTIINVSPQLSDWISSSLSHFRLEIDPTWSSATTISAGGIYTGNWQSTSATTPAVTVTTSQPVTIQNSRVQGPDQLIYTSNVGANLTITNCKAYGQNPNVVGQLMPRFLYAYNIKSLVVTDNYLESTTGIVVTGHYTGGQTVTITNNEAFNIDGRLSNGNGAYQSGTPSLSQLVQFVQLNSMNALGSGKIAWNKIVNVPNESRVEDVINIYDSGGVSGTPLPIDYNYVQGGYPLGLGSGPIPAYTGTGINCGDGNGGESFTTAAAYISAYDNVVVSDTGTGMAIYAGHDISMNNNVTYSAGTVGVDTASSGSNATGQVIWNLYAQSDTVFLNNTAQGNQVGWVNAGYSVPASDPGNNDYYYSPSYPAGISGNPWTSGSQALEQAASASWYSEVSTNGEQIGPNW